MCLCVCLCVCLQAMTCLFFTIHLDTMNLHHACLFFPALCFHHLPPRSSRPPSPSPVSLCRVIRGDGSRCPARLHGADRSHLHGEIMTCLYFSLSCCPPPFSPTQYLLWLSANRGILFPTVPSGRPRRHLRASGKRPGCGGHVQRHHHMQGGIGSGRSDANTCQYI